MSSLFLLSCSVGFVLDFLFSLLPVNYFSISSLFDLDQSSRLEEITEVMSLYSKLFHLHCLALGVA